MVVITTLDQQQPEQLQHNDTVSLMSTSLNLPLTILRKFSIQESILIINI